MFNIARIGGVQLEEDESGVEEIVYQVNKDTIAFTQAPERQCREMCSLDIF